jgi:RNA polymerase sigma factor (sigma-70 family)
LPGLAIAQAGWLAREEARTRKRRETIMGDQAGAAAGECVDDLDHGTVEPEERAAQRERLELVRRELGTCPPRSRQIFQAVYGAGGRSHAEVAHELGISVQRVRQAVYEVRARMRAALKQQEREEEA